MNRQLSNRIFLLFPLMLLFILLQGQATPINKDTVMMKPTDIHFRIHTFMESVENSTSGVEVEKRQTNLFDRFMKEEAFQKRCIDIVLPVIEEVAAAGMIMNEDQKALFYLFDAHFRWSKVDWEEGTSALVGGFAFNNAAAMVLELNLDKWKNNYQDFLAYEPTRLEDGALLEALTFFESPTHQFSPHAMPYYGCVRLKEKQYPNEFYFFDGGIIYPLPFKSYEEYILALLANAGIECWQYFYIDPELLVKRNKGLNYMTTNLRHGTRLAENFSPYDYNSTYDFDRLDIIHEYLNRCARFLPGAFPALNFNHQQVYLEKLEKLR